MGITDLMSANGLTYGCHHHLEKYICVHNISYLVHSVMLDAGKILRFAHVLLGFIKIQGLLLLLLNHFSRVQLCATP